MPKTSPGGCAMAEPTPQTFNHFALIGFNDAYWREPAERRRQQLCGWLEQLRRGVDAVHLYQTRGVESTGDLRAGSAVGGDDRPIPARSFPHFAARLAPLRAGAVLRTAPWGLTQPPPYPR